MRVSGRCARVTITTAGNHLDTGAILVRRARLVMALTGAGLLLIGCASGSEPSAAPEALSSQVQAPAVSPRAEVTPEPTESVPVADPTETPAFDGDPSPVDDASPTAPDTVPTDLADTPLGLNAVFSTVGEWEESRYEVADRSDVPGMGVVVATCYDDQDAPELEFRLANRFDELSFNVAQGNTSQDSDQQLAVRVLGNEGQLDIQKVPFNQVKPISLDVSGVNALKIRLFLDDEERCSYDSQVVAVVEDLKVK